MLSIKRNDFEQFASSYVYRKDLEKDMFLLELFITNNSLYRALPFWLCKQIHNIEISHWGYKFASN